MRPSHRALAVLRRAYEFSETPVGKIAEAIVVTSIYCIIGGLVYSNSEMQLSAIDSTCERARPPHPPS